MASLTMTWNGPEPDDIIGTEDRRASFDDFVESAGPRLLAAARLVTAEDRAEDRAEDLLAGVLARAGRRWWWLGRPGRDPERQVLVMLLRAVGRDPADVDQIAALVGPPGQADGVVTGADLLAAVRGHRARHARRRLVTGWAAGADVLMAAVVVVAAVAWPAGPRPSVTRPAPGSFRSPRIPAVSGLASVPAPTPVGPAVPRAPGTVLRDCRTTNGGQTSGPWRPRSVHAGPVWFMFGREPGAWVMPHPVRHGRLAAGAGAIAIAAGRRAVVRVVGPRRVRFHFLAAFTGSNSYTWHDGQPGLTLGGCPGQLTIFWEGYITLLKCVPLVVQPLPHGRPVHIALPGTRRSCR